MKFKIVGVGQLSHNYLEVGVEYDAIEQDPTYESLYLLAAYDEDGVLVNVDHPKECGFLCDATGDLRWEGVED